MTTEADPPRSTVDVAATDVHDGCVFLADGGRVALHGDPHVATTIHAESVGGEARGVQSVSVLGAVRWEAEAGRRGGRCEIDVLVEVDADSGDTLARGRLCGHELDVTVTGG